MFPTGAEVPRGAEVVPWSMVKDVTDANRHHGFHHGLCSRKEERKDWIPRVKSISSQVVGKIAAIASILVLKAKPANGQPLLSTASEQVRTSMAGVLTVSATVMAAAREAARPREARIKTWPEIGFRCLSATVLCALEVALSLFYVGQRTAMMSGVVCAVGMACGAMHDVCAKSWESHRKRAGGMDGNLAKFLKYGPEVNLIMANVCAKDDYGIGASLLITWTPAWCVTWVIVLAGILAAFYRLLIVETLAGGAQLAGLVLLVLQPQLLQWNNTKEEDGSDTAVEVVVADKTIELVSIREGFFEQATVLQVVRKTADKNMDMVEFTLTEASVTADIGDMAAYRARFMEHRRHIRDMTDPEQIVSAVLTGAYEMHRATHKYWSRRMERLMPDWDAWDALMSVAVEVARNPMHWERNQGTREIRHGKLERGTYAYNLRRMHLLSQLPGMVICENGRRSRRESIPADDVTFLGGLTKIRKLKDTMESEWRDIFGEFEPPPTFKETSKMKAQEVWTMLVDKCDGVYTMRPLVLMLFLEWARDEGMLESEAEQGRAVHGKAVAPMIERAMIENARGGSKIDEGSYQSLKLQREVREQEPMVSLRMMAYVANRIVTRSMAIQTGVWVLLGAKAIIS